MWLQLDFVDASQALFIGCVYFPPPNSRPLKFKSVTARTMLHPLEEDIATLQPLHIQVFTVIVGDFNIRIDQHQAASSTEGHLLGTLDPDHVRKSQDTRGIDGRGTEFLNLLQWQDMVVLNGLEQFQGSGDFMFTARRKRKQPSKRKQLSSGALDGASQGSPPLCRSVVDYLLATLQTLMFNHMILHLANVGWFGSHATVL